MERAATTLDGRCDDFATILGEDFDSIGIYIAEDEVLSTTGEHRDAVARWGGGQCDRGDAFVTEAGLNLRGHGLEFAEARWQEFENTTASDERLEACLLPEAEGAADPLKPGVIHEEPMEGEAAYEGSAGGLEDSGFLGFGAGMLEEFGVIHTGRTGCHAGETTKAEVHFVGKALGWLHPVICNGAHEGDAAARRISFEKGSVVGGAGRQTQPAVHALLKDGVVEILEMRCGGSACFHVTPQTLTRNGPRERSNNLRALDLPKWLGWRNCAT